MQLIVTCNLCQEEILKLTKDIINEEDVDLYKRGCGCSSHGPVQEYDENGNALDIDSSNINIEVIS